MVMEAVDFLRKKPPLLGSPLPLAGSSESRCCMAIITIASRIRESRPVDKITNAGQDDNSHPERHDRCRDDTVTTTILAAIRRSTTSLDSIDEIHGKAHTGCSQHCCKDGGITYHLNKVFFKRAARGKHSRVHSCHLPWSKSRMSWDGNKVPLSTIVRCLQMLDTRHDCSFKHRWF